MFVDRLDWTHTTGRQSILSLWGAASLCTSSYYLRCKARACSACYKAIFLLLVSLAQSDKNVAERWKWSIKKFSVSPGTARNSLSERCVWLVILLTTVVCVAPGLVVSFLRVNLFPTLTDKVQMMTQRCWVTVTTLCVLKVRNLFRHCCVFTGPSFAALQEEAATSGPEPEAREQEELPALRLRLLPPRGLRRAHYLGQKHEDEHRLLCLLPRKDGGRPQLDRKRAQGEEWSRLQLLSQRDSKASTD